MHFIEPSSEFPHFEFRGDKWLACGLKLETPLLGSSGASYRALRRWSPLNNWKPAQNKT